MYTYFGFPQLLWRHLRRSCGSCAPPEKLRHTGKVRIEKVRTEIAMIEPPPRNVNGALRR